ncbi:lipoyl synthase [Alkaliphilus serpentinus]|uniref:Lipoyl synthase n=1 Tax=Alkaliphilus serpentinus TaxID=1482731 RepID=A0A833HPS5_9FIRM|nr:lipoyl synthase [Alkaliphilus serpentinus]KAB3531138.1 lipoyl synthase [Alkaliphilus serpentinus]
MTLKRKPSWLRIKVPQGQNLDYVKTILSDYSLNTVCQEANCPNKLECYSKKTATFMILGRECSRNCRFCNISHGELQPVDEMEANNVAEASVKLGLKHVVVTSVTRDDLPDGGASHFAAVINAIKLKDANMIIEVLIPDFRGSEEALKKVVLAQPHIINHNVETVPRLYDDVRPMADYKQSLNLIKQVKEINNRIYTKSGIMVGMGETEKEVTKVMKDLREVGCDFLTVGQYLPPGRDYYPLVEYVTPETFERYKEIGIKLGFSAVASSPLVRSSYNAAEMMEGK